MLARRFHTQAPLADAGLTAAVLKGAAVTLGSSAVRDMYKGLRETFAKDPTANKFLSPPQIESEEKRKSVFIERASANAQLSQLLSDRSLVMLSAGSATGKTTTMGRFLSKPFVVPTTGKILIPAVCHLELRGVSTPEKAAAAFRKALAVEDESLSMEKLVAKMLATFERVTATSRGKEREVHPIVWVEDIHSCRPDLASDISTALLTISPKVVHTVSEDSGFKMLKKLSGHSRRLKNIPFPVITEEEIVAAISKPFTETKRVTKYIADSDEYVDEFPESTRAAVCDLDVAEYIVSILGSNLGQIDECLGDVRAGPNGIEKLGMADVKEKIASIVSGDAASFEEVASTGAVDEHGKDFVRAAHHLFDALVESNGKDVYYPDVIDKPLYKMVRRLVDLNFLSYANPTKRGNYVRFKTKSLLSSWKEAKADNMDIAVALD